jgi:hypothetical protein
MPHSGMDWLRILLMMRTLSIMMKMMYSCKRYCRGSVDQFRRNFHYKAWAWSSRAQARAFEPSRALYITTCLRSIYIFTIRRLASFSAQVLLKHQDKRQEKLYWASQDCTSNLHTDVCADSGMHHNNHCFFLGAMPIQGKFPTSSPGISKKARSIFRSLVASRHEVYMSGEPSIHSTYGALLDGYIITLLWVLSHEIMPTLMCLLSMYGVFCAQVVWYYRTYLDDRWSFKILVSEKYTCLTDDSQLMYRDARLVSYAR